MVIIYTSPGCASCRKAKQWLRDNRIEFVEKNIFSSLLNKDEIKYLLSRSENGTDDILSVRSKAFQQLKKKLDDYSTNELVELIQNNPSILRRPIMISEKNFVVGYDDDEITALTPAVIQQIDEACNPSCPVYKVCGAVRKEPGQITLDSLKESKN